MATVCREPIRSTGRRDNDPPPERELFEALLWEAIECLARRGVVGDAENAAGRASKREWLAARPRRALERADARDGVRARVQGVGARSRRDVRNDTCRACGGAKCGLTRTWWSKRRATPLRQWRRNLHDREQTLRPTSGRLKSSMRFRGWRRRALYGALGCLTIVLLMTVYAANAPLRMRRVRVDVPVQVIDAKSGEPVNDALVLLLRSCSPPASAMVDEAIVATRNAKFSRRVEGYDLSRNGATVSITSRNCGGAEFARAAIRSLVGWARPFTGCRWVVVDKPGYERTMVDTERGKLVGYDGLFGTLVLPPVTLTQKGDARARAS